MQIDLTGKNAVVCGSTGGIGKEAAIQLAAAGATVTLVARDTEKLKKTSLELPAEQGQKHDFLAVDFSTPAILRVKLESYLRKNKRIHILVNNTGGPAAGNIIDASPEQFLQAFNAHLICNHILASGFIPGMKEEKYGRIINIISTSVKQPLAGLGVSNTIRAAVANWSKTMATELASFGITVNNVLPGATATDRLKGIIENKALRSGKSLKEIEEEMLHEIPMRRFAAPAEIANAVTFLASSYAAYITGTNIVVDGGRTGNL